MYKYTKLSQQKISYYKEWITVNSTVFVVTIDVSVRMNNFIFFPFVFI